MVMDRMDPVYAICGAIFFASFHYIAVSFGNENTTVFSSVALLSAAFGQYAAQNHSSRAVYYAALTLMAWAGLFSLLSLGSVYYLAR